MLLEGGPQHYDGSAVVFGIRAERDIIVVRAMSDVDHADMGVACAQLLNVVVSRASVPWDAYVWARAGADSRLVRDYHPGFLSPEMPVTRAFLQYLADRLAKHRNISPNRFHLYLKELVYRYNHAGRALIEPIVIRLCMRMQKH